MAKNRKGTRRQQLLQLPSATSAVHDDNYDELSTYTQEPTSPHQRGTPPQHRVDEVGISVTQPVSDSEKSNDLEIMIDGKLRVLPSWSKRARNMTLTFRRSLGACSREWQDDDIFHKHLTTSSETFALPACVHYDASGKRHITKPDPPLAAHIPRPYGGPEMWQREVDQHDVDMLVYADVVRQLEGPVTGTISHPSPLATRCADRPCCFDIGDAHDILDMYNDDWCLPSGNDDHEQSADSAGAAETCLAPSTHCHNLDPHPQSDTISHSSEESTSCKLCHWWGTEKCDLHARGDDNHLRDSRLSGCSGDMSFHTHNELALHDLTEEDHGHDDIIFEDGHCHGDVISEDGHCHNDIISKERHPHNEAILEDSHCHNDDHCHDDAFEDATGLDSEAQIFTPGVPPTAHEAITEAPQLALPNQFVGTSCNGPFYAQAALPIVDVARLEAKVDLILAALQIRYPDVAAQGIAWQSNDNWREGEPFDGPHFQHKYKPAG